MRIINAYAPDKFGLSFELFPPKTPAGDKALAYHVEKLIQFQPSFITCTYGAGGSTHQKTLSIVAEIKRRFNLPVAAHLTCVGSSVKDLRNYLGQARDLGIDNIVALRGDPPQGETTFKPAPDGLRYAHKLVALIRAEFPEFGIAVGGYPEVHQEASDAETDLQHLKQKVAAGADVVITQLFYHNEHFFRFRDRYEALDIQAPLIPGIMPVVKLAQVQRITSLCGATLPQNFIDELARRDDADWQAQVGIDFATRQVQALIESGLPGIHFYVLNKSQALSQVLTNLQLKQPNLSQGQTQKNKSPK